MKKIFSVILCCILLAGIFPGCSPAPADATGNSATGDTGDTGGNEDAVKDYTGTFRVGFGRVDITPELGIELAGLGANRKAQFVRDSLYITCIAITDEQENTVLLMTSDSIRTEPFIADTMRSQISRELGIPITHIFSSTTHTHNAPDTATGGYGAIFASGGLEACKLAMADRKPAQMYSGNGYTEGLNFVRHYLLDDGTYYGDGFGDSTGKTYLGHATEIDNEVQLIKFAREAGKDIILMNWRAHPILTGGMVYDISAGYVGSCRKYMEKNVDCHFAYFQGASGNIKDVSEMGDSNFRHYKDQGEKLAQCAIDVLPNMKKLETGLVEVKTVSYMGNIRVDTPEYIQAANTFMSVISSGGTTADAIAATGGLCNSSNAVAGIKMRQEAYGKTGKFELELAAISIGGAAFISTPNEMFDNTGKQIKDASPYEQTFILYLCNGRGKYLPSEPAYTYGCYEKENSYFVKGTAEEIVAVYTDMLNKVHAEGIVDSAIETFDSQLPQDS